MNGRKFLLGALAAFFVGFLLSGVWHVLLMAEFYESNAAGTARETPLFWAVGLGYLVVGFIMAYMYPKGYEGGSAVSEGLKFGAIIGLLWWLPTNLVFYGAMEGSFAIVLVDGGWHVVEQGLAGVALAMVYGRPAQESA
jgi:hypothetical protein